MDFSQLEKTVWERLTGETRPIVLYGMGDGADKILARFSDFGINVSGVFASDEFVRGHSFHGMRVQRLAEVTEALGEDIVIVVAFASQRPEVMDKIYALDARFDVTAPDVPVAGGGVFDSEFVRRHNDEFEKAYCLMADEKSRQVLTDIVKFKLSGLLKYLRNSETSRAEAFNTILRPDGSEHFVDLGAYNGDTIRELLQYTEGAFSSITAFEPDRRNFRKLSAYAEKNLSGCVALVQAGAWSEDTELMFAAKAGRQSRVSTKGIATTMRSLDSVLYGRKCTLLKMDVEGAEREAIIGASNTIRQYQPKLNIAVYHRNEDMFSIPIQVHELCPDYKLFLRHHPYIPAWDTILYARPEK